MANTIGMPDVTCFGRDDGASQRDDDVDLVSRTNSAVISGKRSNGRFATAPYARNKNQGTHARAREDDVAWAREGAAVLGMVRCLDEG